MIEIKSLKGNINSKNELDQNFQLKSRAWPNFFIKFKEKLPFADHRFLIIFLSDWMLDESSKKNAD